MSKSMDGNDKKEKKTEAIDHLGRQGMYNETWWRFLLHLLWHKHDRTHDEVHGDACCHVEIEGTTPTVCESFVGRG